MHDFLTFARPRSTFAKIPSAFIQTLHTGKKEVSAEDVVAATSQRVNATVALTLTAAAKNRTKYSRSESRKHLTLGTRNPNKRDESTNADDDGYIQQWQRRRGTTICWAERKNKTSHNVNDISCRLLYHSSHSVLLWHPFSSDKRGEVNVRFFDSVVCRRSHEKHRIVVKTCSRDL